MLKQKIIAFGAHPDDVEIGMGGTIKRLSDEGHEVIMCIATIPDNFEERLRESQNAGKILGASRVLLLPLGTGELGYNRKTIQIVDAVINGIRPHAVFTHWMYDSHQDHVNLSRCIIAATRKNYFHVFMYENTIPGGVTPGSFRAQYFIDVSSTINEKLKSINAHATQVRRNGDWWVQGIYGRAMYRGYQIHSKFAEAFEVVKINNDVQFFAPNVAPEMEHGMKEKSMEAAPPKKTHAQPAVL